MYLDSRGRLLMVMNFLKEHSNDAKGVTMDEIISHLENMSGQSFDRKAIYRDIDAINDFMDIHAERKNGIKEYKVEINSQFTKEEVEVISNALLTAKFITKKDTKELIDKLYEMTGLSGNKAVTGNIRIDDRIKIRNVDVIGNVEIIREAIRNNCKIKFDYRKYDITKKLFIEKQSCIVSPYEDVWYQDFYYMLGTYEGEKISHYRVDRMADIELLPDDPRKSISAIIGVGRQFNVAEYMSKLVGMSSGYEDVVEMRFKNEHIGDVIDSLGDKVTILRDGPGHFIMRAKVLINKKFSKWVLSFGNGAVVLEPEGLRDEIIQTINNQAAEYKK